MTFKGRKKGFSEGHAMAGARREDNRVGRVLPVSGG